MTKRILEEIFNNDPLGLIDVGAIKSSRGTTESMLCSGFKEIISFYEKYGRAPLNSLEAPILETRLSQRLETMRNDKESVALLSPFDQYCLLENKSENVCQAAPNLDDILNSELLTEEDDSIFQMRFVNRSDKQMPDFEYVANRKPCKDFQLFEKLFKQVQEDLDNKQRDILPIQGIANIKEGQLFIVHGLLAYVASMGKKYEHRKGHHNARLRVIFSNKTESDLLLRSFGASLYKDKLARAISGNSEGPLFGGKEEISVDTAGIVYVLKSLSQSPDIKKHDGYLHKIGVTTTSVKSRISSAARDPTYLLAPVEIVGEFHLINMDPVATEKLLHTFFDSARADIEIKDRFGQTVKPREWFFVTVDTLRQAVKAIQDKSILNMQYSVGEGKMIQNK